MTAETVHLFLLGIEGKREGNIDQLLLAHPLLGTWPTTQAGALTGNRIGDQPGPGCTFEIRSTIGCRMTLRGESCPRSPTFHKQQQQLVLALRALGTTPPAPPCSARRGHGASPVGRAGPTGVHSSCGR